MIQKLDAEGVALLRKYFRGWKGYSEAYKRSIQSNIVANQHHLVRLFRKTMESFKQSQGMGYKRLVFDRLRRVTLESIREVIQNRSIVVTLRKRVALHSLVKAFKYRKRVRRALEVSRKYTHLKLEKKYFVELKINTLLDRLKTARDMRLLKEACTAFVGSLKQHSLDCRTRKNKKSTAMAHYRMELQHRYFQKLKLGKLGNSYSQLRSHLLKTHTRVLLSTYRRLQRTNSRKATDFSREHLLQKYFGRLSTRTIELKTVKLTNIKRMARCFAGWLQQVKNSKQEQSNIPIEVVSRIEKVHRHQTVKQWFNRLLRCYRSRVEGRNRQQMVEDYYELKSTEVLYRKYFLRIRMFGLLSRAEKHHRAELSRKAFQGLQLNFIDETNRKSMVDDFVAKREDRLKGKAFGVLCRTLHKKRKAVEHSNRQLRRTYLSRWLQSVVTNHLQREKKAVHYHTTNLKYKAIFALTTQVELSKRMMDVVRLRVRGYLQWWTNQNRSSMANKERQFQIKAKVFRQLKLLRYKNRV